MKIYSNFHVLVFLKQIRDWRTMRLCSRIYMGWKRGSLFKFLYMILNLALVWVIGQFSFFLFLFLLSHCLLFLRTLPFCSMVLRIVSSFFFHVPWSLQKKKYLLCKGVGWVGGFLCGGSHHILKIFLYCSLTTFDIQKTLRPQFSFNGMCVTFDWSPRMMLHIILNLTDMQYLLMRSSAKHLCNLF